MAEQWVLQLCHCYYAPFDDVARQYTRLFEGSGIRVLTVYLTGEYNSEIETITGGDKVIFLEYTSKQVRGLKLDAIKKIKALHQEYKFAFAVAHRFKPLYICTLVPGLNAVGVDHAFGDFARWSRKLFVWYFRERINLMGVSEAVAEDVNLSLSPIGFSRCAVQYNHVDFNAIISQQKSRADAREKLSLDQQRYYFLNVGRLHPDKDQTTLIEAFASIANKLPDADLVILGKGRLEQSLKALTKRYVLENRIHFLGFVADARAYFPAFDSFVLSSDYEPFGMVLLEAIAAKLPFAVTNCGGAKEIAERCGGHLFELKNVASAASAMEQLYKEKGHSDFNSALNYFSPEAARKHFFSLHFVARYLAVGQLHG